MPTPRARLTLADIPGLPAFLTVPAVADLLGIGRTSAYQLAAANELPVPVVRVGRSLRVPTMPLLALLGIPAPGTAGDPAPGAGRPGCGAARGTVAGDQEPS